ncbi:hypothetical protein ACTWQM_06815 [Virgibacillus sp. L01]
MNIPTKQTSKQWSILLGVEVESAEVYMFRNDPNSTTMYSLFSCPNGKDCKASMSLDRGKSVLLKPLFLLKNIQN